MSLYRALKEWWYHRKSDDPLRHGAAYWYQLYQDLLDAHVKLIKEKREGCGE